LFLDKELNIRRFTIQATKIFKLIKSDIGRPFTDQVSDLIYPELAADALEVLRTLVFIEKQIPTNDGRWFTIRIMPYRTVDDRIDGLVITFINRSDLKLVEIKLHETEQMNRLLLNSSSDVIIKLSPDYKILEFNPEAEIFFGKKREEAVNQNYIQLFVPQPAQKKAESRIKKLVDKGLKGKISMQVKTGGNEPMVEWSVIVHLNSMKKAITLILTTSKTTKP
jgi:two-component system CheB/CheR fusion protein